MQIAPAGRQRCRFGSPPPLSPPVLLLLLLLLLSLLLPGAGIVDHEAGALAQQQRMAAKRTRKGRHASPDMP